MDKEIIKDNKIKLIICIILSLSIFSIYIPINTGGYFTIIMWFVQIIIPIIFGVLIKEYKNFCICIAGLTLSNILSSIFIWIWVQNQITMVKESVKNYGSVFAIVAFGIIADLSIIFTVFVCIECIIYFIVRYKNYKQKFIANFKRPKAVFPTFFFLDLEFFYFI